MPDFVNHFMQTCLHDYAAVTIVIVAVGSIFLVLDHVWGKPEGIK